MGLITAHERMSDAKLRQAIALEAARLMYERVESEYFTAKRKAAKRLCRKGVKPEDLPSNAEIREQIQVFARIHEGDRRTENLREMRLEALRMMRLLRQFRPRLIGSVLTGHVRKGSDIDLHVFSNSHSAVTTVLDDENFRYTVQHKRIVKHNEERVFTHIHVLREQDPGLDLESEVAGVEHRLDRFELYRMLLEPLEDVKQSPKHHPEGDAL